ncbi:MAG TPA: hypothetical protein DDW76_22125, partial [Cyanobacteria bacterium UBA11369]|nr:hypothetical protein [Cyanobacteria bacterium UBA11369]
SLREAVSQAIASFGDDTINLNGIVQLNERIVIPGNAGRITFQGNGQNTSGFNGQNRTQIIAVDRAAATFSNLGFFNGYSYGGDGQKSGGGGLGAGGALFINRGDVTVYGVTFIGNRAVGGNGGFNLQDGGRGGNDSQFGQPGFRGGAGGGTRFGAVPGSGGLGGRGGYISFIDGYVNGGAGTNGTSGNYGTGGGSGGGGGG